MLPLALVLIVSNLVLLSTMELVLDSVFSFKCHHLQLLLYVLLHRSVRRKGMFVSP